MPIDSGRNASGPVPGRFPFFILSLFLLLSSCATLRKDIPAGHIRDLELLPEKIDWKTISGGIELAQYDSPEIPLKWHLLRVDLGTPGLLVVSYPAGADMDGDGFFEGITTRAFLEKTGALAAVNASPFEYRSALPSSRRRIVGLYVSGGEILSPPAGRYAALLLFRRPDGGMAARILPRQEEVPPETDHAFGGFFPILLSDEMQAFRHASLDSRLAAGVSQDGRTLFLLFVEGENASESTGATFEETALILREAGASDALQLDGGGSASMSVAGGTATGGNGRKAANILGFKYSFP